MNFSIERRSNMFNREIRNYTYTPAREFRERKVILMIRKRVARYNVRNFWEHGALRQPWRAPYIENRESRGTQRFAIASFLDWTNELELLSITVNPEIAPRIVSIFFTRYLHMYIRPCHPKPVSDDVSRTVCGETSFDNVRTL